MADRFDQYTEGPESWRWLFGDLLRQIGSIASTQGITVAKPAVLQLAALSSINLDAQEILEIDRLRKTGEHEDLYQIETICIQAANRAGAWKKADAANVWEPSLRASP